MRIDAPLTPIAVPAVAGVVVVASDLGLRATGERERSVAGGSRAR